MTGLKWKLTHAMLHDRTKLPSVTIGLDERTKLPFSLIGTNEITLLPFFLLISSSMKDTNDF
jgi:hypothetical protein